MPDIVPLLIQITDQGASAYLDQLEARLKTLQNTGITVGTKMGQGISDGASKAKVALNEVEKAAVSTGTSVATAGEKAGKGLAAIQGGSFQARMGLMELEHTARSTADVLIMGGNPRMLLVQLPQMAQAFQLMGVSMTTFLGTILPVGAALGGLLFTFHEFGVENAAVIKANNDMAASFKGIGDAIKALNADKGILGGIGEQMKTSLMNSTGNYRVGTGKTITNPEDISFVNSLWTTFVQGREGWDSKYKDYNSTHEGQLALFNERMADLGLYDVQTDKSGKNPKYSTSPQVEAMQNLPELQQSIDAVNPSSMKPEEIDKLIKSLQERIETASMLPGKLADQLGKPDQKDVSGLIQVRGEVLDGLNQMKQMKSELEQKLTQSVQAQSQKIQDDVMKASDTDIRQQTEAGKQAMTEELSGRRTKLELQLESLTNEQKIPILLSDEAGLQSQLQKYTQDTYQYKLLSAAASKDELEVARLHKQIEDEASRKALQDAREKVNLDRQLADEQLRYDQVGLTNSQSILVLKQSIAEQQAKITSGLLTGNTLEKAQIDLLKQEIELKQKEYQQEQAFLAANTSRSIDARSGKAIDAINSNPNFTDAEKSQLTSTEKFRASEEQKQLIRDQTNEHLKQSDMSLSDSFVAGIKLQMMAFQTMDQQMAELSGHMLQSLIDGPANALMEVQNHTKSVSAAFSDMTISILDDIEKQIIKMLEQYAVQQLLSSMSMFGGGMVGHAGVDSGSNTYIPRHHAGSGLVGDEVPVIAKRGEPIVVKSQQQAKDGQGAQPIHNHITAVVVDSPERMGALMAKNPHWIAGTMMNNPEMFGQQ